MKNKVYSYGHQFIDQDDVENVLLSLRSDFLTCGPMLSRFEKMVCDYTGAKYCVAVSNATAGLHLAAIAAGLEEGDEGITSPITFLSTANCMRFCGATVKFADIESDTGNIDPNEILKSLTKKTRVLFPVHFAGQSCDMERIQEIAKKYKLIVIEDAAHAFGSDYKGFKVGSCKYSDMTVFSFHPVKNITTGEGGAITTNNSVLYEKLLSLRSHGIYRDLKGANSWEYEMRELGFNYRLTDIQAALGISQLKKLVKFKKKRRHIVELYNQHLGLSHLIERAFSNACFHLYPVLLESRDRFYYEAKKVGLNLQVHYIPVHLQPYYRQFGYKKGDFPRSEEYYSRTISLPLYPSLEDEDIFEIIDRVRSVMGKL